jgi:hypothetical protein
MAYVNCSISSNNINAGDTITVHVDGCADAGDTWFMIFAWGDLGIIWSTFVNYYYQQCYSVDGALTVNNPGYYGIYGYGYTGDAPGSQQVHTSATVYLTVNQSWAYVAVPNPLGLTRNGVDIRNLYEHRHDDTAKRADVGIRSNGVDISNYFQPGANGYDSGFRSGGNSLGSLFA